MTKRSKRAKSRYAVPLSELERSVHVPLEDQVETQPESPPEPLSPEEIERRLLLGTTGAGRLRPR